jgi:hypothetical protein
MKVKLAEIAFARSGDKGDTANVGLIAFRPSVYPILVLELPNLRALNFLLHNSLGGGGTVSLMLDAQGKTFSTALLRMEIEVPDELLEARGDSDG